MQDIAQFISNVGFPAAFCIILFMQLAKQRETIETVNRTNQETVNSLRETIDSLSDTLEDNTEIMERVLTCLEEDRHGHD